MCVCVYHFDLHVSCVVHQNLLIMTKHVYLAMYPTTSIVWSETLVSSMNEFGFLNLLIRFLLWIDKLWQILILNPSSSKSCHFIHFYWLNFSIEVWDCREQRCYRVRYHHIGHTISILGKYQVTKPVLFASSIVCKWVCHSSIGLGNISIYCQYCNTGECNDWYCRHFHMSIISLMQNIATYCSVVL